MVIFQFAMLNVYQSVNLHFPMVFLWLSQNYMVFLWFSYFSYGFPMIFLWFSYDCTIFLWFSYDCSIFLWFSYGFPMIVPFSYGFPMVFLWFSYAIHAPFGSPFPHPCRVEAAPWSNQSLRSWSASAARKFSSYTLKMAQSK